ncbi:MAG: McrC family protein [Gammaproteobacteria bacterium]|nr:McrC family protein [Gammaproteobacteria bacterium]
MKRDVHTFREHEEFNSLSNDDRADLAEFARKVLKHKDGDLAASKHVGVITTKRGTVVEILPKIDLGAQPGPDNEETTRRIFLRMLRCWRRLGDTLPESAIRGIKRFPMLEAFVHRFLTDLAVLTRRELARCYVPIEENLTCLRGRILFREHVHVNLVNRARFFVSYDELSVNRPANRLIHSTLIKLHPWVSSNRNRQSLRELMTVFADVPQSMNLHDDWRKHHINRSMLHYTPVMSWVRLFLFNQGLATFSGPHANVSLLFPMEQVFEDFVTYSFRRYQNDFTVFRQGPQRHMARIDNRKAFTLKPDLSLMDQDRIVFILDAKWKHINSLDDDPKHGIEQSDVYQLYAYAKAYECDVVALVYPRTRIFCQPLEYRILDDTRLICLPFNVEDPEDGVATALRTLCNLAS